MSLDRFSIDTNLVEPQDTLMHIADERKARRRKPKPETMTVAQRYANSCGSAVEHDSFETHVRLNLMHEAQLLDETRMSQGAKSYGAAVKSRAQLKSRMKTVAKEQADWVSDPTAQAPVPQPEAEESEESISPEHLYRAPQPPQLGVTGSRRSVLLLKDRRAAAQDRGAGFGKARRKRSLPSADHWANQLRTSFFPSSANPSVNAAAEKAVAEVDKHNGMAMAETNLQQHSMPAHSTSAHLDLKDGMHACQAGTEVIESSASIEDNTPKSKTMFKSSSKARFCETAAAKLSTGNPVPERQFCMARPCTPPRPPDSDEDSDEPSWIVDVAVPGADMTTKAASFYSGLSTLQSLPCDLGQVSPAASCKPADLDGSRRHGPQVDATDAMACGEEHLLETFHGHAKADHQNRVTSCTTDVPLTSIMTPGGGLLPVLGLPQIKSESALSFLQACCVRPASEGSEGNEFSTTSATSSSNSVLGLSPDRNLTPTRLPKLAVLSLSVERTTQGTPPRFNRQVIGQSGAWPSPRAPRELSSGFSKSVTGDKDPILIPLLAGATMHTGGLRASASQLRPTKHWKGEFDCSVSAHHAIWPHRLPAGKNLNNLGLLPLLPIAAEQVVASAPNSARISAGQNAAYSLSKFSSPTRQISQQHRSARGVTSSMIERQWICTLAA